MQMTLFRPVCSDTIQINLPQNMRLMFFPYELQPGRLDFLQVYHAKCTVEPTCCFHGLSCVVLLWVLSLGLPYLLQPGETLELHISPNSTKAVPMSRRAISGTRFTFWITSLPPRATSQRREKMDKARWHPC